MVGITDQVVGFLPKWDLSAVGGWIFGGVLFFLFLLILGGFFALWVWWFISKKKFKYTIRIFEKVDGRYKPNITDKAMERKIGGGGDTIFYLQRMKKIIPTPTIQTGNNTFWFAKREDGELINIGMEDIDLKLREAHINYLDKETRYARASLQKLNKDRFNKEGFWAKYGKDILMIVYVLIIAIAFLLITGKLVELVGSINDGVKNYGDIAEKISGLMGKMENLCSNSNSGVVQA